MGGEPGRKPLLRGRGVLPFEDFCRSTGLDHDTVENLMRSELLDIFDDVLPSRHVLAAMGLPVRDDYDPEALRSYDEQTDDDAGDT